MHPTIEWRLNEELGVETESDNPMDGMFWDPVANVQVMPYEVAQNYNRMALKLEAIVMGAQAVHDIFTKVSAAVAKD
jgi:hypothetical protein